jgi:hypothetical protein
VEVAYGPEFVVNPTGFDAALEFAENFAGGRSFDFTSASKAVSAASMPLLIAR